jgi:hypothetical protein
MIITPPLPRADSRIVNFSDFSGSGQTDTELIFTVPDGLVVKSISAKLTQTFETGAGVLATAVITLLSGANLLTTTLSLLLGLSETTFASQALAGVMDQQINATLTITGLGSTINSLTAGQILVVIEYY